MALQEVATNCEFISKPGAKIKKKRKSVFQYDSFQGGIIFSKTARITTEKTFFVYIIHYKVLL